MNNSVSSSSSETYSSYMARLAQNAFRNTMKGGSSPPNNRSRNNHQSQHNENTSSTSSSSFHRPPDPNELARMRERQQQQQSEPTTAQHHQSILRAAPDAPRSHHRPPPPLPPRSPPPPMITSTTSGQYEHLKEQQHQNSYTRPAADGGAASAVQSSATEFLDTLTEREKLYQSPYRQRYQPPLLQDAQALNSSSNNNSKFFPSDYNPQRKASALWAALDSLKQTPVARSGSAPLPPPQNSNNVAGTAVSSSPLNSFGDEFTAANNRLASSQSFSTTSRIAKHLNVDEGEFQSNNNRRDDDEENQNEDLSTSKIADLFSMSRKEDENIKKDLRTTELESLRKQMSITNHQNPSSMKATRESLKANISRSTEAQRKQHLDQERILDSIQQLNTIEQRLTDHQNEHTKLRAQRLLDVDRARWEVQRVDFRVLEVQSQMDAACIALQERLLSRLATVKQLQDDAVRQNEMRLQSAVKGEHDRRIAHFREQTAERASSVESLRVALQQLAAHVEVQCARIEHDLSKKAISKSIERLNVIRHALNADVNRRNASVESMVSMIENFAVETKKQLAELKEERLTFHHRMAKRTEEMRAARLATDARHSRKVATASSFRAPSL